MWLDTIEKIYNRVKDDLEHGRGMVRLYVLDPPQFGPHALRIIPTTHQNIILANPDGELFSSQSLYSLKLFLNTDIRISTHLLGNLGGSTIQEIIEKGEILSVGTLGIPFSLDLDKLDYKLGGIINGYHEIPTEQFKERIHAYTQDFTSYDTSFKQIYTAFEERKRSLEVLQQDTLSRLEKPSLDQYLKPLISSSQAP